MCHLVVDNPKMKAADTPQNACTKLYGITSRNTILLVIRP